MVFTRQPSFSPLPRPLMMADLDYTSRSFHKSRQSLPHFLGQTSYGDKRSRVSLAMRLEIPSWIITLMYALTILSWIGAFAQNNRMSPMLKDYDTKLEVMAMKELESLDSLDVAKESLKASRQHLKSLHRTSALFEHELRMIVESFESPDSNEEMIHEMMSRHNEVAITWVEQRHTILLHKVNNLQSFIQKQSRKQLIEKYGSGPHLVEFTIKSPQSTENERFTVDLFSIDLVPHSVELFLNSVSEKLWNDSIFYHHATTHHVIAAAPVQFGTLQDKSEEVQAVGKLGFGEWHPDLHHKALTLGFSGKGPNMYINTQDNQAHHGPGRQRHHDLPEEADPCFARIASGSDVMAKMLHGKPRPRRSNENVPWSEYSMTRIVEARII